jgi:hypothetical protein
VGWKNLSLLRCLRSRCTLPSLQTIQQALKQQRVAA